MPLGDFLSVYLPYCLKKQDDGNFLVLNRRYKPLGFNSLERFNYEDYPIASKIKGLTARSIQKLAYNGIMTEGAIYLYDGSLKNISKALMKDYLERLEILAACKISK